MPRPTHSISAGDRAFYRRVALTAFSNPFDEGFDATQRALEPECARRVHALETRGLASVGAYAGAERETMRVVLLYEAYQRFREALDELVVAQIAAGETPSPVPFAREMLALLRQRGLEEEEALRIFAIYFQIRRAHHFIVEGLVGGSACMREFRRRLWENVFTHDLRHYERCLWSRLEDFSTLLLGETGTGKGTAAAAIGRSAFIPFDEKKQCFAESFTRTFVSINLSQFPETLIESELFGHRKGAFTGAVEAHEGIFARCSPHGAIFLDEIGEVAAPVQIKLLRVLQERVFSPVGSREQARFRGRVIAATNKPLAALRGPGGFRDDFYYRLCTDSITIPPLRQRLAEEPRELEALLGHIMARVAGEAAGELRTLVGEALRELIRGHYAWPGNVRELEQAVRRILLTRRYSADAPPGSADRVAQLTAAVAEGTLDADALLGGYCALLYERSGNLEEVARRTHLDRRTVKRYLAHRGA
ncbi:MAG TPA: sigma 54-interacting transcriptional regulator [Chthoniobacteraceae bacterium]|jgi:DNA-binding NtrC family response regulator|nr:sigma 54-interacting transcriptional regulator [Chthoniobacteraceae bacterium]